MKKLTIDRSDPKFLTNVLVATRSDRVLLKRGGKPVALVINMEDRDEEQIETENDPAFWKMIEISRKRPNIPWEQAKEILRKRRAVHAAPTRGL
jgi:hypothetical protein